MYLYEHVLRTNPSNTTRVRYHGFKIQKNDLDHLSTKLQHKSLIIICIVII